MAAGNAAETASLIRIRSSPSCLLGGTGRGFAQLGIHIDNRPTMNV